MNKFSQFGTALLFLLIAPFIFADAALTQRPEVQQFIHEMVKEHGFTRAEMIQTLHQAKFQPNIIESMNRPYEKKSWDIYQKLFLTPERVRKGMQFWRKNQSTLQAVQEKYGVPADIIVAIIGVETLYGERQGNHRVLDALTTLAFDYPKRSKFFTKELKEYLLLCREHKVSPDTYVGSYAGAIGKPQFMPSSYRFYAVDYSGNGKRDLVEDNQDVIASVANYLHQHGWKLDAMVAQQAKIEGKGYQRFNLKAKKAKYAYQKMIAAGVKPLHAASKHPEKAGLIELDIAQGKEYWLAYPNFYVITRYNVSPQYALAVYLLAQQLRKQWISAQLLGERAYA